MLLRIRSAAQLTLPAEVRRVLNVKEGDYLEARIAGGSVVLKPVAVVERKRAWRQVARATAKVKDRKPAKRSAVAEERELAREVKALRKRHG